MSIISTTHFQPVTRQVSFAVDNCLLMLFGACAIFYVIVIYTNNCLLMSLETIA